MTNLTQAGLYLALIAGVLLLGGGLVANSILPLYPITASITVKSTATGLPVQGAVVSAYVLGSLVGSGVTNSLGVAAVNCNTNIYVDFVVVAGGYVQKTEHLVLNSAGTATIFLTPGGSGDTYVTVRIYAATLEKYKVRDVKITGGVAPALTTAEGYADVLCVQGPITLTFDGGLATMRRSTTWELLTFGTFSHQVTASPGAVYTVYCPGGTLQSGEVQYNDAGFEFWDWFWGSSIPGIPNYMLLAAAAFLILRR